MFAHKMFVPQHRVSRLVYGDDGIQGIVSMYTETSLYKHCLYTCAKQDGFEAAFGSYANACLKKHMRMTECGEKVSKTASSDN